MKVVSIDHVQLAMLCLPKTPKAAKSLELWDSNISI